MSQTKAHSSAVLIHI